MGLIVHCIQAQRENFSLLYQIPELKSKYVKSTQKKIHLHDHFFFFLLAIFLKVQLQYSAIWENCSNRSIQAWASPPHPSYISFTACAAQQVSCFPGWRKGSKWVAAPKHLISAALHVLLFLYYSQERWSYKQAAFFMENVKHIGVLKPDETALLENS